MKTTAGDGGNRSGGAGSRNRKTKRRRVTADPEALPKEVHGDEQASAAPKGSANDGSNEKPIVRASASMIDEILPNVTRDGFERLVRRQLVEGVPITLADLTTAAKSASKRKAESSSSSSSDTGRKLRKLITGTTSVAKETRVINTEGWAGIPSDVMRDVLGRLNLRDKVVCVSKVCRAWNAFKTTPGLFADLTDESGPSSISAFHQLVEWIPNVKSVTGFRIATTKGCDDMAVIFSLSKFRRAHRTSDTRRARNLFNFGEGASSLREVAKQSSEALSNIEQFVLFGPAINIMLLSTAESCGLGSALETLRIDLVSEQNLSLTAPKDVGLVLSRSKRLQVLEMPAFLLPAEDGCNLSRILSDMVPQGGSETALRILDLTKSSSDSSPPKWSRQSVTWPAVSDIGRYCPHLEVLKLPSVVEEDIYSTRAIPEVVQGGPMACLSRLRVFFLGRIVSCMCSDEASIAPRYYRTNEISAIFSWLLRGMPVLEELSLSHGQYSNFYHNFVLPDIGQGLSECPPTLRKLHLKDFNLEATSLLSPGIDSDSIESITLENCGGSQTDALRSFCLRYQGEMGTQKTTSVEVGDDGTSYFVRGGGDMVPSI